MNKDYSIRYVSILIFFIICGFCRDAVSQERVAYRVEVVVLRLIESSPPPESVLEPRDLSDVLDLADRAAAIEQWLSDWPRMSEAQLREMELSPPLNPLASRFPDIEGLTLITDRSERMSTVWRNLRLSAEYRPEIYFSWEQAAEGDFPDLRIHNDVVIMIEDKHAVQRVAPPVPEPDSPPWEQKIFRYDLESGAFTLETIPEPEPFYSVDGTIRMRRSRFLHIDLDISYQVPAPSALQGLSGPPLKLEHQGYQAHRLVQSRQIRTNRMEYFDSPVLGALVWVTPIERPEDDDVQ